ncbi:putative DNA repair and recombination protein RAD54-like [Penaeus vannamei]|uniref:Putative DNA repair and recombination protein RAD54-like n=1 Tax=Penaeus vannamei TaxID=6689 RepID=A0A3R7M4P1_PENVA|nr:putative DNA repair and recombination protein RAD54-like [Penaeus vannamei]
MQEEMYVKFLNSSAVRKQITDGDRRLDNSALAAITSMKKLCNHPDLIWEKVMKKEQGYAGLAEFYPANHDPRRLRPELSGKVAVLDTLLALIRSKSDDKVVHIQLHSNT